VFTVNILTKALHTYGNPSGAAVRRLCMATPAGLAEFFLKIGDRVDSRTAPTPNLTPGRDRGRKRRSLLAKHHTDGEA
jgi:hypothetical protein